MDKNQVRRQAKQILDKFAKSLSKIKTKESGEDFYVDREEFERKENEGCGGEKGFRKRMLKNAPEHNDDFVIVERGDWK